MSDVFFGGAYEAVLRLLKKPKFAMFGEEEDSSGIIDTSRISSKIVGK